MIKLNKLGVTGKLATLFLLFALVPLIIVGASVLVSLADIKKQAGGRFENAAVTIADKIDRSLFERYGDVQAFSLNRALHNQDQWYRSGTDIEQVMNQYVATYGIYYLTIFVDTEGKVAAVNSRDAAGNAVNTSSLYGKDYSDSAWFQALKAGTYTTRMPFTAKGNDVSTGTYIEDLHIDSDVKLAYDGDDGMTLGFSAPVYQGDKIIGYWSNRTKFSLVEEFFTRAYEELKRNGYPGAELTLLDKEGRILVDYDPVAKGTVEVKHDLGKIIMKFNLAEKGVGVAQQVVKGGSGYEYARHARKQINQAAGYAHLQGALGYPGMNWGVLVRVPVNEAAPWLAVIQRNIVLILLVCAAVVVAIGIWLGRQVVRLILPVVDTAGRAAKGDLTGRIRARSNDEIGDMGNAFDGMLEKLTDVVGKVRMGSDSILSAAREIATGNTDLSQRTEEQASSLEETASSMEQMTSTVKQNADNARQANQLANAAREQAEKGGTVVTSAVNAMSEINQSSKKIADIIGVIDEIAFQTNLLALNAAVEAARAGEQGRGFAVVATEVRNLAQRSATAAKEIKDLINESVNKVRTGSELVDKSGATLTEIVQGVKKVSDIVSEIAAASQEQSDGIDQVNKAVMQMDEMTQQNAALVEQAAASAKSMEEQAQNLNELVSFFRVDTSTAKATEKAAVKPLVVHKAKAAPQPDKNETATKPKLVKKAVGSAGGDDEWEEF